MKKIILFLIASIMTFTVSAQELVRSKFFDNTYVEVNGGISKMIKADNNDLNGFGKNGETYNIGISLGKWVTPSFGGEFTYNYYHNAHKVMGSSSFFGGNLLLNVSNAFWGYKGEPRFFEVVPFVGGGYYKTYDVKTHNITARTGMKFVFNIDNKKSWQLNLTPTINYLLTDYKVCSYPNPQPRFDINRSWVNVNIGITYKFKTSNGTHNFKYSDKLYTQEQLDILTKSNDELIAEVNHLRELAKVQESKNAAMARKFAKLNNYMQELTKKNVELCNHNQTSIVGFEIGKDKILKTNRSTILNIAEILKNNQNSKVVLNGYSDSQTGSAKRNMELSNARVETVKNELVKLGVDENRIETHSYGDTVQPFNENVANRVVISIINY
jgi:outer membrane protein OmpA-like peptidoglycan-associated protein